MVWHEKLRYRAKQGTAPLKIALELACFAFPSTKYSTSCLTTTAWENEMECMCGQCEEDHVFYKCSIGFGPCQPSDIGTVRAAVQSSSSPSTKMALAQTEQRYQALILIRLSS